MNEPRLILPGPAKGPGTLHKPGPGPHAWKLETSAVVQALNLLHLVEPLQVKLSAGQNRLGSHRWRWRRGLPGWHVITLSTFLSPSSANRTLWHELIHAAQHEFLREQFDVQYAREGRHRELNRFEVEAESLGGQYAAVYSLVRRVTP